MPYIKHSIRYGLDSGEAYPEDTGQLNFLLTQTVIQYMDSKGLSYQTINDVVGALEGAKLEFYRRVAAPYESAKMVENGDVYDE